MIKNNKGFTLVELITTIAIICVVLGVAVFSVNHIINNSKERSKELAIEELKKSSNDYMNENIKDINWINDEDSDKEFTCVSVMALINYGYYSKTLLDNEDLGIDLYSYVKINRNKTSKAIINEEIGDDSDRICSLNFITIPECNDPTYNGRIQEVISSGDDYTIDIDNYAVVAGDYKFVLTLNDESYNWNDAKVGTTREKECKINKRKLILKLKKLEIKDDQFSGNNYIGDETEIIEYLNNSVSGLVSEHQITDVEIEKNDDNTKLIITSVKIEGKQEKIGEDTDEVTVETVDVTSNYDMIFKESAFDYLDNKIDIPTSDICKNVFYSGNSQALAVIPADSNYTLSQNVGKDVGNYNVMATPNEGYEWRNAEAGSETSAVTIVCSIGKKPVTINIGDIELNEIYFEDNDYIGSEEVILIRINNNVIDDLVEGHKVTDIVVKKNDDGTIIIPSDAKIEFIDTETGEKTDFTDSYELEYSNSNLTLLENITNIPTDSICNNPVYNGKTQILATVPLGESYTLSQNVGTAVGSYNVVATPNEYFKWTDGTTDTKTVVCKITSATCSATLSNKTVEYTGSNVGFDTNDVEIIGVNSSVLEFTTSNLEFTYFSDSSCTTVITDHKEVGTYYGEVKVSGITNYNSCTSDCAKLKISENSLIVTFNANGGKVSPTSQEAITNEAYGTLPTPTRTGYKFEGWYTAASGGDKVKASTVVTNTSNHTLYAHWTVYKVRVKYNINGGTWNTSSVTTEGMSHSGNTVTKDGNEYVVEYNYGTTAINLIDYNGTVINASKTGYSVKSGAQWNTKSDGSGTSFSQATGAVDANDICDATSGDCTVTLYINWKINYIKVKYNINGGTWNASSITTEGMSHSGNTVTKDGSTYVVKYKYGTTDINLVNYNGGVINASKTGYIAKSGAEWNTKSDGSGTSFSQATGAVDANDICNATSSDCTVTLYINWRITKIKVQIILKSGDSWGGSTNTNLSVSDGYVLKSGSNIISTYSYGTTDIDLPNPDNSSAINIVKTGYKPVSGKEWISSATGSKLSDSGGVSASSLCNAKAGDCTTKLYVNWTAKTVKVTFMRNHSSSDTTSTTRTYTYRVTGQSFSGVDTNWAKTGYTRKGWNTSRSATTAKYSRAASVSNSWINSNSPSITLYAIYKDETAPTCSITKTVTYSTAGVDLIVKCSDSGSGCVTSSTSYYDVTSSKTYTVKDKAGNSKSCSVTITKVTQRRYRTRTKSCKTCKQTKIVDCASNAGCCPSGWTQYASTHDPVNQVYNLGCYKNVTSCSTCGTSYGSWGSWSSWTTSSCTKSSVKQCQSRTVYK